MEVNKSVINKTGDLTPPIPNNVEFGAKWVQMSPFGVTTLWGESGGGGRGLRDEPYVTITWKGFPTVSEIL